MPEQKHVIKKAVVEIYLDKADGAFDTQNKVLSLFKEKIIPVIEKIVNRYAHASEIIRIDKLELDFYDFNSDNLQDTALLKFEQQIEDKLIQLITEKKDNSFSGETIAAIKKIPTEKADEELFIYLLKTGILPWWAKTEDPISLELLAQKVLQQSADDTKQKLITSLSNTSVRKRIAYQLSATSAEKIIALISSELINYIHELLNFQKNTIILDAYLQQELYEYALKYSAGVPLNLQQFISGFIKNKNDFNFAEKIYSAVNNSASTETMQVIKNALADTNDHFTGKVKKLFDVKDVKIFFPPDQKQNKASVENLKTENDELKKEQEFISYPDPIESSGDYFIKNAGVIIITPYLPLFFKALGLSDGKQFVSDEAAERAIYLLHYLSSGDEKNREEHEMVLNKILCGVEITKPLTLQFIISENEKEECLNLLQAVADNWTALKGTSGEGMRDAFFKRDGILEQQSNGWNLKIEKTTIDILLDKLPWGLSIIQMPWNKAMIFVE